MTLVQGHNRLYKKCPFVTLSNYFQSFELGDKFSDQCPRCLDTNHPIAIGLAAAFSILKYTKEDLQQIFKIVLETQALIISGEPRDKLLKAHSPDM